VKRVGNYCVIKKRFIHQSAFVGLFKKLYICFFALIFFLNKRDSTVMIAVWDMLVSRTLHRCTMQRRAAAQPEQHGIWYRKDGTEIER
jgi:hypothetical protein